mgnify:CR=1 FL=1
MVNVKNLFGMAVMATALVGCASNDDLTPNGNENESNKVGTAYASFTIELPSTRGTRTAGDPVYNPGDANEYAVNNAQLVIFKKNEATTEGEYQWVENVEIGNLEPWNNDTGEGVTRYANITAALNSAKVSGANEYFALIILNNAGESKVALPSSGDTYSSWNIATKAKSAADFLKNDNGFYMANAPKYVSTTAEPTTLVSINGIYRTKEEAQNHPATTVYVERGMAKVTVANNGFTSTPVKHGTVYENDNYEITGWALDVLNKHTFPVHMTTGLMNGGVIKAIVPSATPGVLEDGSQTLTSYANIWKNELNKTDRFVGTGEFKRVYWGIDPNYSLGLGDVDKCKEHFYIVNPAGTQYSDGTPLNWSASTTPLYCLENTFDLNNMKQGQTTRVIFKAVYTPNGIAKGKNFYKIGINNTIWSEDNLIKQIKAKAQEVLKESDATKITVNLAATSNDISGEAGTKWLEADNINYTGGTVSPADINNINNKLGLNKTNGVGIATYKSGESYYIARIKHFNDLTKWKAGDPTYGTNNDQYLGRYGVLRNNWYELTVNSVSGPGYPDVPEIKPDTPDDEDTKYINVSVKILDWAKRSQTVDL